MKKAIGLKVKDFGLFKELSDDVDCLARFTLDAESYSVITPLFFDKWQNEKAAGLTAEKAAILSSTVTYLKETWFDDTSVNRWYQGACPQAPITNNSLESNNAILKSAGFSNNAKLGCKELFDMVSSQFRR